MGKRAIAETGRAPYSPSWHGAEGTDTKLVSLISASYLCIKNSALQSFSVTMLLPSWEELILFQETTAKHDVKQQAWRSISHFDFNRHLPQVNREEKQLWFSTVMLIIKDHSILIAIYTRLQYILEQISSCSFKCTETVQHIFRSPWIQTVPLKRYVRKTNSLQLF